MKRKLLSLLTLAVLGMGSAWADNQTVFLWQYDGSSTYGDGSNNGEFDIANTSGIGTVKFVTYEKKKTSAEGTIGFAASVTDTDLKPSITKGCKLGNNGAHIKISPASGNFKAGDIIYVCGYNPVLVTTSTDPTSTANITTDTGDGGATAVISSSLTIGSAKGSYAVGSVILPDGFTETDAIYISRVPSTSVGIAAIKVVRPDQSKLASNLTVTSDATLSLDPEQTSQITYTSSSTGTISYTSASEAVATVSGSGLITAVAVGTTTITISQTEDATYRAGRQTITVTVNKVRKATTVTGEFILDTTNGTQANKVYTSNDGSVIIEAGSTGNGSNTYFDLKNSHFKISGDCVFTLPTNYSVKTVQFVGYSNSDADRTITLKEVDGVATEQSGTILKRNQIPATDCVGFELATPATESMTINVSNECRGYFILNPDAKEISMTKVGTMYYSTFYSAGETTISGATAYTATLNGTKTALTLTECVGGIVPGRTGVILIGNNATATATPSFTGSTKQQGQLIGAAEKEVTMSAYYASGTSAADKVFVLGTDNDEIGLYKYKGSNLGVGKAYLYDELLGADGARSLKFEFDSTPSAIKGFNENTVTGELKKYFENGKIIIESNGVKFNTAGQKVD